MKCEEDILNKLDCFSLLGINLAVEENNSLVSEDFDDKCKTLFLSDFDSIRKEHPDVLLICLNNLGRNEVV